MKNTLIAKKGESVYFTSFGLLSRLERLSGRKNRHLLIL